MLVLKPDSVGTVGPDMVCQAVRRRGLEMLAKWDIEIDVVHVLSMWPLDPRKLPVTFLVLCYYMVGFTSQVLVCYGPDAVNKCIDVKEEVRIDTGDFLYSNVVHCADSLGEAVSQCGALLRPSELKLGIEGLLPDVWHGWAKDTIIEASKAVWQEAASFGWTKYPNWSPFKAVDEIPYRIQSPRENAGRLDSLVLRLTKVLDLSDLATAIRAAYSTLYEPGGLPVPVDTALTIEDLRVSVESQGLILGRS